MPEERLQKILSRAGVTSRRKAEEMIAEGRVSVNGTIVSELGSKADLERDHIKVDGKLLRAPRRMLYLALNKPKECVTTVTDPQGRETVMKFLRGVKERVYPVGRLDYSSEGLLLFTNDGEFANRITAAASHVPKLYQVKVNGRLTEEEEQRFRDGIPLEGRRTAPAGIRYLRQAVRAAEKGQRRYRERVGVPSNAVWYEVRLIEGRQNQIREMFRSLGKLVEKLRRVKIGFLELGKLKPGEVRHLTEAEVERFKRLLKMNDADGKPQHP
jgi:23S rRNA pseudouridine2605 synthase